MILKLRIIYVIFFFLHEPVLRFADQKVFSREAFLYPLSLGWVLKVESFCGVRLQNYNHCYCKTHFPTEKKKKRKKKIELFPTFAHL